MAPRSLDPSAPSVGLYHNRNRWLSPELGRYLQRDPNETTLPIVTAIAFNGDAVAIVLGVFSPQGHYGDGLNLYAYLGSNPVNLRDPLGLVFDPFEDVDDAIGAYERDIFGAVVTVHQAEHMIKGAIRVAALYAALAFAWDEFVWYLGEEALLDIIAGPFFSTICFEAGTGVLMANDELRSIEDIRVGERVWSEPDPLAQRETRSDDPATRDRYDDIDPATWREVELQVEDAERGLIRMTLLRPIQWLEDVGAEVGSDFAIDLPDFGGAGVARVMAVRPCPTITPGTPQTALVTGTFITERASVMDLFVEGLEKPIGVTPTHPLYSTERDTWVEAAQLVWGESVRSSTGDAVVSGIRPRTETLTVYGLEIYGTHTYFVSRATLWVHNACEFPKHRSKFDQKQWIVMVIEAAVENGQPKRLARDFVLNAIREARLSKQIYKELVDYLDYFIYTVLEWAP